MAKTRARLSVMFKPTTACNLRCGYCYAEDDRVRHSVAMDEEEMRRAFTWLREYCQEFSFDEVQVVWHGGEPTLLGVDFMTRTLDYYEAEFGKAGISVSNGIQTNLACLDDDLVELLRKRFAASIGVSLDWNTGMRRWPDGHDSTAGVVANIKRLKAAGAKLTAISVVTDANVKDPAGMYRFFKELGVPFRANRLFPNGTQGSCLASTNVTSMQYAEFINSLVDIMLGDAKPHVARTACDYILAFLRDGASLCCLSEDCASSFICVAPGGVVLPCSRFGVEEGCIGDYTQESPSAVKGRIRKYIANSVDETEETRKIMSLRCPNCRWRSMCHSGCLHSRKTGWLSEECEANRMIWEHISEVLNGMGVTQGFLRDMVQSHDLNRFLGILYGNK